MGGLVIAQDVATAAAPWMPRSAVETGAVDLIVPLNEIASTLVMLVARGGVDERVGATVRPGVSLPR
jgi:chemotaxis response regulator CheB